MLSGLRVCCLLPSHPPLPPCFPSHLPLPSCSPLYHLPSFCHLAYANMFVLPARGTMGSRGSGTAGAGAGTGGALRRVARQTAKQGAYLLTRLSSLCSSPACLSLSSHPRLFLLGVLCGCSTRHHGTVPRRLPSCWDFCLCRLAFSALTYLLPLSPYGDMLCRHSRSSQASVTERLPWWLQPRLTPLPVHLLATFLASLVLCIHSSARHLHSSYFLPLLPSGCTLFSFLPVAFWVFGTRLASGLPVFY